MDSERVQHRDNSAVIAEPVILHVLGVDQIEHQMVDCL